MWMVGIIKAAPFAKAARGTPKSAGGAGGGSGVDATVAAFALLEIEKSFEETSAVEVGPENLGDEEFGVGDLPEKEIADAHFSAGTDEEIGIG